MLRGQQLRMNSSITAIRTGAPLEVVENLQSLEDEGDMYESIEEIWPDYPTEEDYLWNEDEY